MSARVDRVPLRAGLRYRIVRGLLRILFQIGWRLRVEGLERLPAPPYILAPKHSSEVDPLVLGAAMPDRIVFLVSQHLERFPFVYWFVRGFDFIFVRRGSSDVAGVRAALARLERGDAVAIYPEGRVVQGAPLGPLHDGPAFIAVRAGVPVVPVVILGASRLWPLGARWPRRSRLVVRVGVPLVPSPGETAGSLTGRLRETLLDLFAPEIRRPQSP